MKLAQQRQVVTQVLADNKVIQDAAMFAVEVEKRHGKVPQFIVEKAEVLKVPLLAIAMSGRLQADHARKRLEALNAAIEYVKGDKGARKRYLEAHQQADRLAELVAKRVERI